MVSIQNAKKNPDGMKGMSSESHCAPLSAAWQKSGATADIGRYQLEHQADQGVLRLDHLGTFP